MQRYNKWGYLLVFLIPIIFFITFYSGAWWHLWILPFLIFVVFPLLDPMIGCFVGNPTSEEVERFKDDKYYRVITMVWVLVQSLMMAWLVWLFCTESLSWQQWIPMLTNTFIMTGGVGITVAHELGHKTTKLERFLSKVLLVQVFYGHFYVEHNRGHHVHVGTEQDPASSKFEQNFYSFWKQTVFGSFKSALKLEADFLKAKKKDNNFWNNQVKRLSLMSMLLFAGLISLVSVVSGHFHWMFALFILLQAFLAFSLLEAINYIEHYGLRRKQLENGHWEPVSKMHSWNANFMLSNFLLFQLQRHSDHHLFSTKRYHLLKQYHESPQLPNGYPGMVILSLIPWAWFKVMNQRLRDWEANQKE